MSETECPRCKRLVAGPHTCGVSEEGVDVAAFRKLAAECHYMMGGRIAGVTMLKVATEIESLRADQSALHAVLQKWCGEQGQEEEGEWICPSEDPDGYDTPGIVDWAFGAWSHVCDRNEKQSEEIATLRAEVERLREDNRRFAEANSSQSHAVQTLSDRMAELTTENESLREDHDDVFKSYEGEFVENATLPHPHRHAERGDAEQGADGSNKWRNGIVHEWMENARALIVDALARQTLSYHLHERRRGEWVSAKRFTKGR